MRNYRSVLIAGVSSLVLLVSACTAPPPPSDPTLANWPVLSEVTNRSLQQEITVVSDQAALRATITTTVLGAIRVCAIVDQRDVFAPGTSVRHCAEVISVPGTALTVDLPVTSPTGQYPFEGVVDLTATLKPPLFSVGRLNAVTDAQLGCIGWRQDGAFDCL
jgi:hypothetical protein